MSFTPHLDRTLRAAARNAGERALADGRTRAHVALLAQQIRWAEEGRFCGEQHTRCVAAAELAIQKLEHLGLDGRGKPLH